MEKKNQTRQKSLKLQICYGNSFLSFSLSFGWVSIFMININKTFAILLIKNEPLAHLLMDAAGVRLQKYYLFFTPPANRVEHLITAN